MKSLLALALLVTLTFPAFAADAFFKPGERLHLQPTTALQDNVTDVTVLDFGPGSWVLVEYDRTFSKAGESGLKTEKAKMWINFAHILSAKVVAK